LAGRIDQEVAQAYQWLAQTSLSELVDKDHIKEIVMRLVRNSPYTDELHQAALRLLVAGIQAEMNQDVTLAQIVPKQEYDSIVKHVARFEQVRIDIIRGILNSPIYSDLISDVLYHGIKDYIMTDNPITKMVPGVSSLMKMGARTVNKAMPNLEASAETTIKKYIAANINRSLALSEKILNNSLDERNIRKVADHFWNSVAERSFSEASGYVDENQIDQSLVMAKSLWLEVRKTTYLENLIGFVVDHIFAEYGERPIKPLIEELGFDAGYISQELQHAVPHLLASQTTRDYVQSRVKAELASFYGSDAALGILNSPEAQGEPLGA
jgi:hypothetical protein